MERAYWHKQTTDEPLFPDLLWSKPENRAAAGKLLIAGGNAYGFAAPAAAFEAAQAAGVGVLRVLLPDSVQHTVGRTLAAGEYAPSTPSGSFSQQALNDFLVAASWADGVLIAGDLGRNSETAILLEKFIEKYNGQLTIARDAADYFTAAPQMVLQRPNTTLVLSFAQLQRLAMHSRSALPFTFDMDLLRLIESLHTFSAAYPVHFILKHLENIFVVSHGEISSTRTPQRTEFWRVQTAAYASVWLLQNPAKPFQALTTAVRESLESRS